VFDFVYCYHNKNTEVVVDGKDGRDDAATLQHDSEANAWFT